MRWVKSFINKEFQGLSIGTTFLLIFVGHLHAQNEPVDITITFDKSFELSKIQYGYYDGRETHWSEPLSENIVHLKDTLYGKLGALYVRYNGDSIRDSKDFFIRAKKTSISFKNQARNDFGILSNFKGVNATCFDSLAVHQELKIYQKDQTERMSAFWEQYGHSFVPGRKDSINDKFVVLLKDLNSSTLSFIETYNGEDEYLYYLFKDQVLTSSLAFWRNDISYLKNLDEFLKNRFSQSFLDANDGKYLNSMLSGYIQVRDGEVVPDFTAFDINGNKISSDGL